MMTRARSDGLCSRQVREGRRVGTKLNIHDVTSRYCQQTKEITVDRLDQYDDKQDTWQEVLVEDRQATPADIAVTRIDFAVWLRGLSKHRRQIAKVLARGETTKVTAKRFGLTAGRISQMRREFQDAWREFQGETVSHSVKSDSSPTAALDRKPRVVNWDARDAQCIGLFRQSACRT